MVRVSRKREVWAKRLYEGAQAAYIAHYRECWACYAAHREHDPRRYCERGWELAKTRQATYIALCRARGDMSTRNDGQQLALF